MILNDSFTQHLQIAKALELIYKTAVLVDEWTHSVLGKTIFYKTRALSHLQNLI